MADKIPTKVFDTTLKDTVFTDQYGVGLNQKVQSLLKSTEDDIVAALARNDPTSPTMTKWKAARLEKLQTQISDIVKQGYGSISSLTGSELTTLAKTQAKNVVSKFNDAIGVDLFNVTLTPDSVKSIVQNTLIDGATIKEWWNKQSVDTQQRLSKSMAAGTQALQIGLVQAETVGDLIGRIRGTALTPGVMSVSKREATALVRTSVMQVANATRQETYKANADVLDGFEFIATLDARTCPRCAVYDGKQYDMNMQPIGHDLPFPGVPVHWNCRCTLAPSTKSWAELAGLDSPLSKDQITELDAVPVGDRVSMNGLIVGDTNYSDWLSSQDEATQQEILGPNRYQLWVENKLDMSDLVNNNGMPLTIKALQVKLGVSIPVYDEVEVKAATKLYSEGLIDGRKTSYMSNAIIKNESTEEASIMVGATEDHLKSAKVLLDGIRKAEVSEESLHRSLVFGDQINEKTKVLKMALDNIKVGETISMDRISSFSSDPSWAAYYGVAGKHKEILNYKLEIIGPHKAFQTDVYTGLSHKESVTEGLFEVVEIKGKSVSNIAYPYNGQVRYSKTIVLRQKEVF